MKIIYLSIAIFLTSTAFTVAKADQKSEKDYYCQITNKIYKAYETGDFVYVKSICLKNKKDAYLFPTCQLLLFLADKISTKDFILAFPNNENDYDLFINRRVGCRIPPPKIFTDITDDTSPMSVYYGKFFELMGKGNRDAIKTVLNSMPWADGVGAEELDDLLHKFVVNHPEVVLRHWDLFSGCKSCFESEVSPFSKLEITCMENTLGKIKTSNERNYSEFVEILHKIKTIDNPTP